MLDLIALNLRASGDTTRPPFKLTWGDPGSNVAIRAVSDAWSLEKDTAADLPYAILPTNTIRE